MVRTISLDEYSTMNATQKKRLSKEELCTILESQIGQPSHLATDTLRNIIKDTIERTIEEKIPDNIQQTIQDMKDYFMSKTGEIINENKMLKKTVLEQQKFLEGMRREEMKNNIFISGIPASYQIDGNEVNDKKQIINEIFGRIDPEITVDKYMVAKIFEPGEGRTRYSAKIKFNDFGSRMAILRNSRKLGEINGNDTIRKVFIRSDDPPITRKENKRLSDKLWTLKNSLQPGTTTIYKLSRGKLLRDDAVIDQFDLSNQIFH